MAAHVCLSLETTAATAAVIALLRRHTGKPISDLRGAMTVLPLEAFWARSRSRTPTARSAKSSGNR
jgi:hypothetical protein